MVLTSSGVNIKEESASERNYIISCLDDCSRKVASMWSEKKRSVDVLNVLENWIMVNGKPDRIMHDNGSSLHLESSNISLYIPLQDLI